MCEVIWTLSAKQEELSYVVANCGIWQAELAYDVYSKGQVMILAANWKKDTAPFFLGQHDKVIPEPENLMTLIDEVSRLMVKALKCQKVYLASLNESKTLGLHFRLIPRYNDDIEDRSFVNHKRFLEQDLEGVAGVKNDGFNLLSELRNKFIRAKRDNKWGRMPPQADKDGDWEWNDAWRTYAEALIQNFRMVVETTGSNDDSV